MKLSDIRGERALEVVADLIDPICNIAQDEKAAAFFRKEKVPPGMDPKTFLLRRVQKTIPPLLNSHRRDVLRILSAIEGSSLSKYESSLTLAKLMKDWVDLMTDSAFFELFLSAQNGDTSGSAQENTADQRASGPLYDTPQPDGSGKEENGSIAPM